MLNGDRGKFLSREPGPPGLPSLRSIIKYNPRIIAEVEPKLRLCVNYQLTDGMKGPWETAFVKNFEPHGSLSGSHHQHETLCNALINSPRPHPITHSHTNRSQPQSSLKTLKCNVRLTKYSFTQLEKLLKSFKRFCLCVCLFVDLSVHWSTSQQSEMSRRVKICFSWGWGEGAQ